MLVLFRLRLNWRTTLTALIWPVQTLNFKALRIQENPNRIWDFPSSVQVERSDLWNFQLGSEEMAHWGLISIRKCRRKGTAWVWRSDSQLPNRKRNTKLKFKLSIDLKNKSFEQENYCGPQFAESSLPASLLAKQKAARIRFSARMNCETQGTWLSRRWPTNASHTTFHHSPGLPNEVDDQTDWQLNRTLQFLN